MLARCTESKRSGGEALNRSVPIKTSALLLPPEQPLRDYPWSICGEYVKAPGRRPGWRRADRFRGERGGYPHVVVAEPADLSQIDWFGLF